MEEKLAAALIMSFPEFYQDPDDENALECSFECGDGWCQIICDLCLALEALKPKPKVRIHFVKEKMGTLRIHASTESSEADVLIRAAEQQSQQVCETCGAPGRMHSKQSILMVRCDTCWRNYFEAKEEE